MRIMCLLLLLLVNSLCVSNAQVLKGRVDQSDEVQTRVQRRTQSDEARPSPQNPMVTSDPSAVPRTRVVRRISPPQDQLATEPQASSQGKEQQGKYAPEDFAFKPREKFDLESERGSRELMLAWELWHKHVMAEMYRRLPNVFIGAPGSCAFKMTVTRDRRVSVEILTTQGNPRVTQELLSVAYSLDSDPGLSFPSESQREEVSFSHVYLRARNITPGYTWTKNDYEVVRTDN